MSELTRSASRLDRNTDFERVLTAMMKEKLDLVISASTDDMMTVKKLLDQYHAIREFGDYVEALAEEEKKAKVA